MFFRSVLIAAVTASLPAALAQTTTECNPLTATCPSDPALNGASFSSSWTSGLDLTGWTETANKISFGNGGAQFTVAAGGDAPTLQSDFYIFFGKVEVTMRSAPGVGIVSSIVLLSDVLDEIDWEFVGGNNAQTQTNYFGKGNTTTYDRAIWYNVADPENQYHTYTIDWNAQTLSWAIDGAVVRTLAYADANGGSNYPQTPMRIRIGNWAGGAPGNAEGTIEWAGGQSDFSQGPFNMYVQSVKVTNYSPGSAYSYNGNSGSDDSITVENGSGGVAGHAGSAGSSSAAAAVSSSAAAPTPSSSTTAALSSSASASTTAAAGLTVSSSVSKPANSIKGSTVRSGAQLTTIGLPGIGGAAAASATAKSNSTTPRNSTTTTAGTSATVSQVSGNGAAPGATFATASIALFFVAALAVGL